MEMPDLEIGEKAKVPAAPAPLLFRKETLRRLTREELSSVAGAGTGAEQCSRSSVHLLPA